MNIVDHGVWRRYTPAKPPKDAPHNAVYSRREDDGVDWYDYVRPHFLMMFPTPMTYHPATKAAIVREPPKLNFKFGSVVCNVTERGTVGAATRDPTAVYAVNQRIIEITDYAGADPQAEFGGKVYDPAAGTLSDPPPVPAQQSLDDRLEALERRVKALEARKK